MACEPLAQAALSVKLTPRRWNMVLMFMFTVEFMDWKIRPDPSIAVSLYSSMIRLVSMTGLADESLPNITPTSLLSR